MSKYCHSCALSSLTHILSKSFREYELIDNVINESFILLVDSNTFKISVKLKTVTINDVAYMFGSYEYLLYLIDNK
jgi:hypothetical protein